MPLLFTKTISIPTGVVGKDFVSLVSCLAEVSKTEARRLIKDGAVYYEGPDTEGRRELVSFERGVVYDGGTIKVGKLKFFRLPIHEESLTAEVWDELPTEEENGWFRHFLHRLLSGVRKRESK